MARPSTAGITAWLLIQTMPKNIPPSSVGNCPRATHHRKRPGDRWSAVPGWSRGRRRTRPSYGAGHVGDRIRRPAQSSGDQLMSGKATQESGRAISRDPAAARSAPSCGRRTTSKTKVTMPVTSSARQGRVPTRIEHVLHAATSRSFTLTSPVQAAGAIASGVSTDGGARAAAWITRPGMSLAGRSRRGCANVVRGTAGSAGSRR